MSRKTPAYLIAFLARMNDDLCFERRQVRAYFLTENEGLSETAAWARADEIEFDLEREACAEVTAAEVAAKARGAKALAARKANKAASAKADSLLAQVVASAPKALRTRKPRPEVRTAQHALVLA